MLEVVLAEEEVVVVDSAAHSIHGKIDMTECHCSVLLSAERGGQQPHEDTGTEIMTASNQQSGH